MDVIKVSGTSRTSAVAGAIAGVFRENKRAEVQAIGAGAVNQAVKALVLAKGYLSEDGYDVVFTPEFTDVEIDGKVRTAIKMTVELRHGNNGDMGEPEFTPASPEEDLDE
jgi:stage V sporulation protein S